MREPQIGDRVQYLDFGFWGYTGPHEAIVIAFDGDDIDLEYLEGGVWHERESICLEDNYDGCEGPIGFWCWPDQTFRSVNK